MNEALLLYHKQYRSWHKLTRAKPRVGKTLLFFYKQYRERGHNATHALAMARYITSFSRSRQWRVFALEWGINNKKDEV